MGNPTHESEIMPGKSFEFTFTKAGVYRYHSVPHPWMQGAIIVAVMPSSSSSDVAGCLPASLKAAAITAFPVKEATSLPKGYSLKAVEADDGGSAGVILYYADHSLCPFVGSLTDQIKNGTLVITVMKAYYIANGTDFQQREMAFYANDPDGTVAKVQAFDVAGHKSVGWEPFTGEDIIRVNGKVVQSSAPIPMGGMLRFFDDKDRTIYTVTAIRPLSELKDVAESIR